MRRRYTYLLLFALPALLASLLAGTIVLVFTLAVFWVFVFGDDTWPTYANVLMAVFSVGAFTATFCVLLYHAYVEGRRQEDKAGLGRRPVAYAMAATLALLIVPALYGWHSSQNADTGPAAACARDCAARGFAGSGIPPRDSGDRTCTCYGPDGPKSFPPGK